MSNRIIQFRAWHPVIKEMHFSSTEIMFDKMRGLEILMRHRERTPERATRYQDLNEDLRKVKITEAEVVYYRNML